MVQLITYTYTWKKDGVDQSELSRSYNANAAGNYYAVINDTNSGCSDSTSVVTIEFIDPPNPAFSPSASQTCQGIEVTFDASSSAGEQGKKIVFNWDFDNSNTDTGAGVTQSFDSPRNYNITLSASYEGIDEEQCAAVSVSEEISVETPQSNSLQLKSDNDIDTSFEKCPSGELNVFVNDEFENYEWKKFNESTNSFEPAGDNIHIYTAQSNDRVFVTVTETNSCINHSDTVSISNYSGAGIFISLGTSPNAAAPDEITLEDDQDALDLAIISGLNPTWTPEEIVSGSANSNEVTIYPRQDRQTVVVLATDEKSCLESDTITVLTKPLKAKANFSPNGDGINDCWQIAGIADEGLNCQLIIFDGKGRTILNEAKHTDPNFEDCVWNGMSSGGKEMPQGVYFYSVNCHGTENTSATGSILLTR